MPYEERVRIVLALAALVTSVFVAGCGSTETGNPGPVSKGAPLEIPTQPATDSDVGMAAGVGGIVHFDEATGCVLLVAGQYRWAIVWPTGTTATRDPFRLVLPDGSVAREGSRVEGGGGFYSLPDHAEFIEQFGVPGPCLVGRQELAVFNPNEAVTVGDRVAPEELAQEVHVTTRPSIEPGATSSGEIAGAVVFEEQTGCVLLDVDGVLHPAVWPVGTSAEPDPFVVNSPDGSEIADGETISAPGTMLSPAELAEADGVALPPACAREGVDVVAFDHRAAPTIEGEKPLLMFTRYGIEQQTGTDGELAGTVEYDPSTGCVNLIVGTTRHPIVWPDAEGTRRPLLILLYPDGDEVVEGSHVSGQGSLLSPEGLAALGGRTLDIPEECLPATREIAVFAYGAELTIDGG